MLLRLPVEIRFMIYRNIVPQHVRHVVISVTQRPSLITDTERSILQTCGIIRDEFLPLLYAKISVEIRTHQFFHALPIQRTGLGFIYPASGDAPWGMSLLARQGPNVRFLRQLKMVQKLSGSHTVCYCSVWTRPLRVLYEALRANLNIEFQPEMAGLLSADATGKLSHNISIDILNWDVEDVEAQRYLEVSFPSQRGPQLVFEYQLEWVAGEAWSIRHVEKLCDVHKAIWRVPGEHLFHY